MNTKYHDGSNNGASCTACGGQSVEVLLDFGSQAFSNRFTRADSENSNSLYCGDCAANSTYHLRLGSCTACLTVQLIEPPSPEQIRMAQGGVSYTEPEAHLDDVVAYISALPEISKISQIMGLSPIDGRLLEKLKLAGFVNTIVLQQEEHLGIAEPGAGIETIQACVIREAGAIRQKLGVSRLVVARAIVEHSHNVQEFLSALKILAGPEGYILLELPDCERDFRLFEYSSIWEEHICYFTRQSLSRCLLRAGLELLRLATYEYPYESISSVLLRASSSSENLLPSPSEDERELIRQYKLSLTQVRLQCKKVLETYKGQNRKTVIFGAGHLAVSFIKLLQVEEYIDAVIDDNPQKQGRTMPGTSIPIFASSVLEDKHVGLCLLSLSHDSEAKVRASNRSLAAFSGDVKSIFQNSPDSIFK